jgi:DNA polymerase-3 subunit delta'
MALKNIIGQEKAVNILLSSIKRARVPSSYLFAGESGIGKKFTAVNIAKALNCLDTKKEDACDECSQCKKIDNQTHPDFLLVSPESNEIRVEEIRAVEEMLSFAPYEGNKKIVIIDNAETMNSSAANAFLKTLEEPPAQSLIILVSSSPDRLPETIRSRCSRVNFLPLSTEKCEEVINNTYKTKNKSDAALSISARIAMGRPGLAIGDDLVERRNWTIKLFEQMVNGEDEDMWADREEMEKWFESAILILRDIAVFKITGNSSMLISTDIEAWIGKAEKNLELKDIIECYAKISFLKKFLEFNLNKTITWNFTGSMLRRFMKLSALK